MNRRLNQFPFTCIGCGVWYEIAETHRNQRNGEWVCSRCWEAPSKITSLPAANITTCEQCGLPCDASNRTIDRHGRVVHGGKGKTCPTKRMYSRRGAATSRAARRRKR